MPSVFLHLLPRPCSNKKILRMHSIIVNIK